MFDDPIMKLLEFLCLLFSLSVHEAAHAIMANRCGDPTARLMGRATLNPVPHIDPIGTILLPLMAIFTNMPFLFGWAKPVPFNPRNLHNMRRDSALIGLAGPFANLMMALTAAVALKIAVLAMGIHSADAILRTPLTAIIVQMVGLNIALMLFNMIPIPPLDGHHLLGSLLPLRGQQALERFGSFGLIFAILIFSQILRRPLYFMMGLVIRYALMGQG